MASVYARGGKLWCRLKDEGGKWISKPTPYSTDEKAKAQRYADAAQKAIDARRADGATDGAMTVAKYALRWIKERETLGIRSVDDDEARLRLHVLPVIGAMRLDELKPRHVRDLVRALRASGDLAASCTPCCKTPSRSSSSKATRARSGGASCRARSTPTRSGASSRRSPSPRSSN